MYVPPHELVEGIQQQSQLQVGVVVLLVRLQDLDVEEYGAGQEGPVADLLQPVVDAELLCDVVEQGLDLFDGRFWEIYVLDLVLHHHGIWQGVTLKYS